MPPFVVTLTSVAVNEEPAPFTNKPNDPPPVVTTLAPSLRATLPPLKAKTP